MADAKPMCRRTGEGMIVHAMHCPANNCDCMDCAFDCFLYMKEQREKCDEA